LIRRPDGHHRLDGLSDMLYPDAGSKPQSRPASEQAAVSHPDERIGAMKRVMATVFMLGAAFAAGFVARDAVPGEAVAQAQARPRVYELRTYTAAPGRLDALHARFRDHILKFFAMHGMTSVAFFKPTDAPLSQTTMIYLISHESREAAAKNWAEFRNDPEWKKVQAADTGGPLTSKIESVFLEPTDYSPLK
jgi:hypothetical protein